MMAAHGILGEYKGSQAREVLMTLEEYERLRAEQQQAERTGDAELGEEKSGTVQADVEDITSRNPSEGQKEYAAVDTEED